METMAFSRERFGRNELVFPDPVPDHALLVGRPEIARGEYSIVLHGPSPERVFKLVSSPADHFFLTADDRPSGPHFPVVHADHGIVGRASSGYLMHLVELERLDALAPGSAAARDAECLMSTYWAGCQQFARLGSEMGRVALYDLIDHPPAALPASIVAALESLSNFIESYQVRPDILSEGNLMARRDGTLVFSDPVFLG